ncbi:hypothetical protein [Catenuloplanes japonicus]|uniref:hypothetical protein n=1 Tax=Catenuloplanes japonicus TaxID=33876 RepID=UPI001E615A88|nr:hypothetical protein [Catenuloplanes japonicus]
MSVPSVDPHRRDPAQVASTDTYRPEDRVWVFRGGEWRAGIVEVASRDAATVTYRPSSSRGTGVDTITARFVQPRSEIDPMLDKKIVLPQSRTA